MSDHRRSCEATTSSGRRYRLRHRSLSLSPDPAHQVLNNPPSGCNSALSDLGIHLARVALDLNAYDSNDDDDDDESDNENENEDKSRHVLSLAELCRGRDLKGLPRPDQAMLIGSKNSEGDTALHVALKERNEKSAAYLIRKKPEMAYELNRDGISPLYLAVNRKLRRLVSYLFRRLPGTAVSIDMREKLLRVPKASVAHAAVRARDSDIFRTVFSNLPDLVESKNEKGWKPISYAAYKGYRDEFHYFLEYYPDCAKECEEDGSFPIHKAISGGNVDIVAHFISRFPEVMFQKDKKHRTVLHIAARYCRIKILHYFMAKHKHELRKFLKLRDDDGNTYKDLLSPKKQIC